MTEYDLNHYTDTKHTELYMKLSPRYNHFIIGIYKWGHNIQLLVEYKLAADMPREYTVSFRLDLVKRESADIFQASCVWYLLYS